MADDGQGLAKPPGVSTTYFVKAKNVRPLKKNTPASEVKMLLAGGGYAGRPPAQLSGSALIDGS